MKQMDLIIAYSENEPYFDFTERLEIWIWGVSQ